MIKKTTKDFGSHTTTEELIDFTASPSSLSVDITPQSIPSYYDGWAYSVDDVFYKTSYNSNSATEQFTTAGLKSIYVRGFRVIDDEEILADTSKKEDVNITSGFVVEIKTHEDIISSSPAPFTIYYGSDTNDIYVFDGSSWQVYNNN